MRLTSRIALSAFVPVIFLAGCAGGPSIYTPPSPTATPSTVALTLGDVPPAGVTVLSFQLTVTGAVLEPGDVSLLSAPVTVDVARLQVETALLSVTQVPSGDYSSLLLSFANPQLAVVNNSPAAIGACAPGAVCALQPSLTPATLAYSGSPFPLTVGTGSSVGIHLDFNLNNSLQGDLSINPVITASGFLPGSSLPLEPIDSLLGMVKSVDAAQQQFTLQPGEPGANRPPLTVAVNSQTLYVYFDQNRLPNNFSGLAGAVGLTVEVHATVEAGGILMARKVVFKEHPMPNERGGGGTIVSLASPLTQCDVDMFEDLMGEPVGAGGPVTVMFGSTTQFYVDAEGLTVPGGLSFAGPSDLLVGQSASASVALIAQFIADGVVLEKSVLTATVKSVGGTTLVVDNLPGIFPAAGITEIQVVTSPETDFRNMPSAGGLSAGDVVSVRGFLFKTSGDPVLVADIVRKQ